jgi:hypothetical protein
MDRQICSDRLASTELSRFAKTTGTVRAVNMNGRCLVEFDQFNNIAWYDIDPSHLKVVTEPLPKPEKQAKAKAAPAAKTTSSKASSPQKKSTADILAAAARRWFKVGRKAG